MGWMHLMILHRSCIRSLVHDNVGWRTFSTFFKMIGVCTWWLSILRMLLHTNMLCKSLRVCGQLYHKWLGIHFLYLPRNDINSVLKSLVCKFLSFLQIHPTSNSANTSWARQVCSLLKFQLCIIGITRVELKGPCPPKFQAYLVFLCGDPKQIQLLA